MFSSFFFTSFPREFCFCLLFCSPLRAPPLWFPPIFDWVLFIPSAPTSGVFFAKQKRGWRSKFVRHFAFIKQSKGYKPEQKRGRAVPKGRGPKGKAKQRVQTKAKKRQSLLFTPLGEEKKGKGEKKQKRRREIKPEGATNKRASTNQ